MLKHRIRELDVIRAIAIFFVVFGHVLCYLGQSSLALGLIYSTHMPVLFTLSGFVVAWAQDDETRQGWARQRVVKSAKRLLVPYVLFGAILAPLVAYLVKGDLGVFPEFWRNSFIENHGLWYLTACFILICSYVASELLGRRRTGWGRLAIGVGLAVPVGLVYWLTKCDFLRSALSYWFSFYAGVALARWPAFFACPRGWLATISLAIWGCLAAAFVWLDYPGLGSLIKPFTGLTALAPLAFLAHFAKKIPYVAEVGESTLAIYCVEFMIGQPLFLLLTPPSAWISAIYSLAFVLAVHIARRMVLASMRWAVCASRIL